jgi:hypothetical protein
MIGLLDSPHEGERLSALRGLGPVLQRLKLKWIDIGQAVVHRQKLLAAAQQLETERDAALAEIERLRRHSDLNAGQVATWAEVGMPTSATNRHAGWLLSLAAAGALYLTVKERDFVTTCSRWRGPLTAAQQPWLLDIVRRAVERTGERPPA